ncbi:AbrB/MazE/SpoVT family DNA-binding domain-containing protein [Mesorhizobium xinjiangense]|uniref:AbrB/MazE/SpoVT family DNA-binding domain-containing protein n=1 Tax=Mesorhizobium xinjiangense TaxID=2678685 RepID=UPI0012EDFF39|nr:AbrB/MazE/SpoVT family DNA-binding domain-containing protein [Mesorhizobium xinjiangense]
MPVGEKEGFGENPQSEFSADLREEMLKETPQFERVKLGEGGRFVIPASMREKMGVKPGDTLIAHVEDGELHVLSYEENLRRIQEDVSSYKKPGESVVDEFLAERRAMWGEE